MGKDLAAIFNMLIDPASAVERLHSKWVWVLPLMLLSVCAMAMAWLTVPLTLDLMMKNPPEGVKAEDLAKQAPMIEKFAYIGVVAAPVSIVTMTVLTALLLLAACTVLDIRVPFVDLFKLLALASIVKVVQLLATVAVIWQKREELQSMAELSPAFGLDILLGEDAPKMLQRALNYFSVFELWYLVMLALGLAAFAKISKGKAAVAITPVWLFGLIMALVASFFGR
jgi:hypothetical protein